MQCPWPSHSLQPQLIPSAPGPRPQHPPQQWFIGTCSSPAQGQAPNHAAGLHVRGGRHVACLRKEAELWQCPPSTPQNRRRGLRAAQRQPDRPPIRAPFTPGMKTSICELGYFCWGHPMCPTGLVAGGSSQQEHGTDGTGLPNTMGGGCTASELPPLLTEVQAVLTGHHSRLGLCEGLPTAALDPNSPIRGGRGGPGCRWDRWRKPGCPQQAGARPRLFRCSGTGRREQTA